LIQFFLACAALLFLCALIILFPRRRALGVEGSLSDFNLEWYRQRRTELKGEGAEALRKDVELRLLEDEQQAMDAPSQPSQQYFASWSLLPLVAIAASALYFHLGAAPDVAIDAQLKQLNESTPAVAVRSLIDSVESRSIQRPENLQYQALLGQLYMRENDYSKASRVFQDVAREAPEDSRVLAYAAQAEYMAAGQVLNDDARLLAEQALAVNPHDRTALGMLGMASFRQQQYRAAIEYWQRLLATETPGSESMQMITGVIEQARASLAAEIAVNGTGGETEPAPVPAVESMGVTVAVSLPKGASVNADDTVFILARASGVASRMPIAVQRFSAADLPLTVRLDDSNSMAGQKLSSQKAVDIIVQISPDGRPGEANATWLGRAGPLSLTELVGPVEIILEPRAG